MSTYVAHFTPEAWVRDQAIEVDAEGPQEWDCTAFAGQHEDYLTGGHCWNGDLDDWDGVVDNDDMFIGDPAAPEWVRNWHGPFTIRVRRITAQPDPDDIECGQQDLTGEDEAR